MAATLKDWVEGPAVVAPQENWVIAGPALGKSFTIRVTAAAPARAALWAEAARRSLYNPDTKQHLDFFVPIPRMSHDDPEDSGKLYINVDKHRCAQATDRLAKRYFHAAQRFAETMSPKPTIHLLRREGVITANWIPIIKNNCYDESDQDVEWDLAGIRNISMNKPAIVTEAGVDKATVVKVDTWVRDQV